MNPNPAPASVLTRREMIRRSAAAAFGLGLAGWSSLQAEASPQKKRVLFFSKSSSYEHDAIRRHGKPLSSAEQILADLGPAHGIDFTFSKDGSLFSPEYLEQFDALCFYTSGDLLAPGTDKNPPMTLAGKAAFLDAVRGGKGFIGIHSAADTFHTGETVDTDANQVRSWRYQNFGPKADPYTRMLGAGFIVHGFQQIATLRVADHAFPGFGGLEGSISRKDEWYSLTDFSHDLHVLLVQDTASMKPPPGCVAPDPAIAPRPKNTPYDGYAPYQRAPYPATWARMHGQGRVFYTSMGHGDNGPDAGNDWDWAPFRDVLWGGLAWAVGNAEADITPNIAKVTPFAWALPPPSAPVNGLLRERKAPKG